MIEIIKLETDGAAKELLQNTYAILKNNTALLVDASAPLLVVKKAIKEKTVKGVLLTHCHYDHILYLNEYYEAFRCPIYISAAGFTGLFNSQVHLSPLFGVNYICKVPKDKFVIVNNNFNLKEMQVKCIETPGHSACSVCYLIEAELFTGDTLFAKNIGRTDLPTSSTSAQINSLKKLQTLKFNNIYPGHSKYSSYEEQQKNIANFLNYLQA